MQPILNINNISKAYGPIRALNNVSFDVPEGSVYGILGPNGSGKTTLLGIVLDVILAQTGSYAWFGGMETGAARQQIGALLETPNFYHYLSAVRNLEINASIKQKGKIDIPYVLELTGLTQRKDSLFQTYSLGMKQRLAIAAALIGKPKVLLLDEPTNSLDPAGIAEIRQLILDLNKNGTTIIIASHLLDEVEKVCSHVAILKKGDLLVHGPVNEVLASEDQLEIMADDMQRLADVIKTMTGVLKIKPSNGFLQLSLDANISAAKVNGYCCANGVPLSHLVLKKKSLEHKFIELTNEKR